MIKNRDENEQMGPLERKIPVEDELRQERAVSSSTLQTEHLGKDG